MFIHKISIYSVLLRENVVNNLKTLICVQKWISMIDKDGVRAARLAVDQIQPNKYKKVYLWIFTKQINSNDNFMNEYSNSEP